MRKIGNTVLFSAYVRHTSNITMNKTLFNVPSGFRPEVNWTLPCFFMTDSAYAVSRLTMKTNGDLINDVTGYGRGFYLSGVYLVPAS